MQQKGSSVGHNGDGTHLTVSSMLHLCRRHPWCKHHPQFSPCVIVLRQKSRRLHCTLLFILTSRKLGRGCSEVDRCDMRRGGDTWAVVCPCPRAGLLCKCVLRTEIGVFLVAPCHSVVGDCTRDEYKSCSITSLLSMCLSSSSDLTVMEIIGRIEANQDLFQRKYAKKMAAEEEYYQNRYKLQARGGSA